jgi:Tfp pilus assembly protein PilV
MGNKGQGTRDRGVASGQWPVARLGATLHVANVAGTLRVPFADPGHWPLASGPCRRRRHAITLLEVLMSMFVLAVGLLSVASLLPVGSFQAARALIDDRKAVLGQNAARDAKSRGVLRPDFWRYPNGTPFVTTSDPTWTNNGIPVGTLTDGNAPTPHAITDPSSAVKPPTAFPPLCVDPWMISAALKNNYPANVSQFPNAPTTRAPLQMQRVTLVQSSATTLTRAQLSSGNSNDQAFTSEDDLTFALDQANPDSPPAFGFNGSGLPTTMGGNGTKRLFNGQFTWLATLVPVYGDPTIVVNRNLMELSVVVFNQRVAGVIPPNVRVLSPSPPATERTAGAVFKPGGNKAQYFPGGSPPNSGAVGIGAAEIQLIDITGATNINDANNDLKVNVGEWIMLGTLITDWNMPLANPANPPSATNLPIPRPMFRWYRIVAASRVWDPNNANDASFIVTNPKVYARDVTLAGPEWNLATVAGQSAQIGQTSAGQRLNARDGNLNLQFMAFIFDGATAVYERTVRIEGPSMWSN